jgi:hypothetical protein
MRAVRGGFGQGHRSPPTTIASGGPDSTGCRAHQYGTLYRVIQDSLTDRPRVGNELRSPYASASAFCLLPRSPFYPTLGRVPDPSTVATPQQRVDRHHRDLAAPRQGIPEGKNAPTKCCARRRAWRSTVSGRAICATNMPLCRIGSMVWDHTRACPCSASRSSGASPKPCCRSPIRRRCCFPDGRDGAQGAGWWVGLVPARQPRRWTEGPVGLCHNGRRLHERCRTEIPATSYSALRDTATQFHGPLQVAGIIDRVCGSA